MLEDSYAFFDVEIKDKIAHIRMNRPETMNAMNKDFWNELPEIIRTIDGEAMARVIVTTVVVTRMVVTTVMATTVMVTMVMVMTVVLTMAMVTTVMATRVIVTTVMATAG